MLYNEVSTYPSLAELGGFQEIKKELAKPSPCDGCAARERCREERLACLIFYDWVTSIKREPVCMTPLEPAPTREIFEKCFLDGVTEAESAEIRQALGI